MQLLFLSLHFRNGVFPVLSGGLLKNAQSTDSSWFFFFCLGKGHTVTRCILLYPTRGPMSRAESITPSFGRDTTRLLPGTERWTFCCLAFLIFSYFWFCLDFGFSVLLVVFYFLKWQTPWNYFHFIILSHMFSQQALEICQRLVALTAWSEPVTQHGRFLFPLLGPIVSVCNSLFPILPISPPSLLPPPPPLYLNYKHYYRRSCWTHGSLDLGMSVPSSLIR